MFRNREAAARELADALQTLSLVEPLILAIPCGGMVIGSVLASRFGAELDVYLCRKMRSTKSGHSLGAVSESGAMAIDRSANGIDAVTAESLVEERSRQMMQIACSQSTFRAVRAPASIAGRSVVVADDGLVTGSTMMAALDGIRRNTIRELVAAVPIASSQRLAAIRRRCDRTICVIERDEISELNECYAEFPKVSEDEAVQLLKNANSEAGRSNALKVRPL